MKTSILYKINLECPKKIKINQGGTSSGKTYGIMQVLFTLAMLTKMQVITVVGQDIPNLKKGAYRDAKNMYSTEKELTDFCVKNETARTFTGRNGSIIEFTSYKDAQDAKSGKRDYLFINEADGISYEIYWQLAMRTRKGIYIDYNPTSRFWVHEYLIGKPDAELIISDHRHNPFLNEEEHDKIESIEDEDLFNVYARGRTGKIKGLILTNWDIVESMPENYKLRCFGLDFGFVNDPTAKLDIRLYNGELWVDELTYMQGMTNEDIANEHREQHLPYSITIVADSAEQKSIEELKRFGLRVEPSQKGRDSIKAGIDILKRYKIHITKRSSNIRKELLSYKWKVDKSGIATNEPVDFMNHAIDALRYVALNKLGHKKEQRPIRARVTQNCNM